MLVLLLQAAGEGLRLPFIEDELVAGVHRVLELDAHLAVLPSALPVSTEEFAEVGFASAATLVRNRDAVPALPK